ncbi:hypothetical protein GCM10020254_60210 [Streptomyces goshikiensis]
MIRREEKLRPPSSKASSAIALSPLHGGEDLDPVALADRCGRPLAARDHGLVQRRGDAGRRRGQGGDHRVEGGAGRELARLAVDGDGHAYDS